MPAVFVHRSFALLWAARVLSTLAFHVQAVAVGWQLYDLTGSPLDLGLVGLVQFLPMLLFTLVAGHAADRYDRRRILVLSQVVKAAAALTLVLGTAGNYSDQDPTRLRSRTLRVSEAERLGGDLLRGRLDSKLRIIGIMLN